MFGFIGELLENTVKVGVGIVSIPAKIVNDVVVAPVANVVEAIKEELED